MAKKIQAKKPEAKIKKKIKQKKSVEQKKVLVRKKIKPVKKVRRVIPAKAGIQKHKKHSGFPIKLGMTKKENTEFPSESLFKARIKVIGIGGGGGSIVSEIGRSLEKASFVVADTDIRALKKKSGIKYFWFGEEQTHGLGTGVNVDLAKQAAESAKEKMSSLFKDQDIVVFVASLGGGLGSGATQVFVEAAREFGGISFGIFTLPFKFEGKNKLKIAQNALKFLRQSLNVSLVIPNEKIFKIIDENTVITDAFSMVNKSLIESLESLIDLIYSPGIINIDFADLRAILKGMGNTAFLNTVEESGKDRAEKICQKILVNPLLQNKSFTAEKILFNIAGSENLSMLEVEKISSHITNLNSSAKIIFGISKNQKLKNKIKITILMTGLPAQPKRQIKKVVQKIRPEPVKDIIKAEIIKKPKKKSVKKKTKLPVSFIPVIPAFEVPVPLMPVFDQKRIDIIDVSLDMNKKTIRRSGLEIKRAEEQDEKKRLDQEKEWEIPAFLRRVKYKN